MQVKAKVNYLFLVFPFSLVLYALIAMGKVLPIASGGVGILNTVVIFALLIFIYYAKVLTGRVFYEAFLLYFPIFFIFTISSFFSQNVEYTLEKLDGAVFFPLVITVIISSLANKYSLMEVIKCFILAYLFVLILTLIYKFNLGFWNRNVRYFINGPIVFGWISSIVSLFSLYIFLEENKRKYLIVFFICVVSVFWTLSKGPILALLVTLLYLFLSRGFNLRSINVLFLVFSFLSLIYFSELQQIERLLLVLDYSSNSDANYGSVGSRVDLYIDTLRIINDNYLFGVGLGNWQYFNATSFIYPHNVTLEVFSEIGVIFGFTLVLYLLVVYYYSHAIAKIVMIYFSLALQFSGDLTYIYFMLFIPAVTIICRRNFNI
ncbi:O-antigen ligase family protein [Vibrio parahaemolyticus]